MPDSAGDVEEGLPAGQVEGGGRGPAEIQAATVHGGREAGGESRVEHRGQPVVRLRGGPAGGLAALQDVDEVAAHRALAKRGVVGPQRVRRVGGEVVPAERRQADRRAIAHDQAHGREQRDHHVGRPLLDAESGAQAV